MFSNTENQLLAKLLQKHISALEHDQKSESIAADQLTKSQIERKVAVTILTKLEADTQAPADPELQVVNFNDPVLIVDDDLLCREMLSSLLKEIGFTKVISELDGYRAISAMKRQNAENKPIKMILCDWNMPNMSGLELLDIVRKDTDIATMPFFLVTSNHDKAHIIRALKAGVTGYLVKPMSFKTLREKLMPYCSDA